METEKEFIWTDEKIFEFIQLRKRYAALFTGRKGTLPAAYGKVAAELGFTGPYTSLKKRWENLFEKYKKCKYPRSGLGMEGGDKGPLSWKFYVPMDEVLGSRYNVAPVLILDSGHDAHQEQAMMLTCSSHPEGSSHLAAPPSLRLPPPAMAVCGLGGPHIRGRGAGRRGLRS
ncbi:uncharacterized protein LOC124173206 isoform X1 [Ischnura elegans]|uniref:uncharacterized protein LOC124173206 isoform X1 n=1 Tax=Ischnura elegans TaxID=197161 RepID=UPI001ED89FBB|nr:uncharacterized protein LOC124173206 isoform X1 [Ischnura elegans]